MQYHLKRSPQKTSDLEMVQCRVYTANSVKKKLIYSSDLGKNLVGFGSNIESETNSVKVYQKFPTNIFERTM